MFYIDRDDALGNHDAVGLAEEICAGRVSSGEVLAAATERVEIANERLNAVVGMVAQPRHGEGPFAGVPSFVKDNNNLAGMVTRHGSRATPDVLATESSPFIADMQSLGFNFVGKSTMPEFGLTASTETLAYGPTRNPRNLKHSVGGSSGGSAALVAAGAVPLAHANDGGGSIRIPAACCGLVGLKPSRGRFSLRPEMEKLPLKIGHEGVVTRTVRDTAAIFHELGKIRHELPPLPLVQGPGRRLRIGFFVEGISGIAVDADTQAAIQNTALVCEGLGHEVEEISFPFDDRIARDFVRYWSSLAFAIKFGGKREFGPGFDRSLLEPVVQELASRFPGQAFKMPSTLRRLLTFAAEYEQIFDLYDVLLSPVTSHSAPELGYLGPDVDAFEHLVRLLRFVAYTPIQNISGAPAISLPLGVTDQNVPIGIQFAAPFGGEETLLEIAFELEQAVGWK